MTKTLTISELIKQKEELLNRKEERKNIFIKSMGAYIEVKVPSQAILLEAQNMGEEEATKADEYIIYQCTVEPNLKDKNLHVAYGCVEPLDIISKIFLPGEIASLADKLMNMAGFGGATLKN